MGPAVLLDRPHWNSCLRGFANTRATQVRVGGMINTEVTRTTGTGAMTATTVAGHLHPEQIGVEAGQRRRVGSVNGRREQLDLRAGAVPLAQVERMAGRIGQSDPGDAVGEPGGPARPPVHRGPPTQPADRPGPVANALGAAKDARDSGHSHPAMALVTPQVFPGARCSRRERGDVVRQLWSLSTCPEVIAGSSDAVTSTTHQRSFRARDTRPVGG
jgi:hypothetical protein